MYKNTNGVTIEHTIIDRNEALYTSKEHINICRKIRNYASAGKLIIDTSKHTSNKGLNTHLFKLIEECGIDVKTFITGYLSCLQPYNLRPFQSGKHQEIQNQTWLCEFGYKVDIVIKLNETNKEKPIIISFHESKFTSSNIDLKSKPCAVIIDRVLGSGDNIYNVEFTIQKGFIRRKINCSTRYLSKDTALINYKYIESEFLSVMQLIFDEMSSLYGDSNRIDSININNKRLNTFSILSYGYSAVNNLIMFIDMYDKYTDNKSRMAFASVASEIIFEIPTQQFENIKDALESKYANYNNSLYLTIRDSLNNILK